jgi:hypothetical protein
VVGHVPGVTLTKWRTIWADRFRRVPLEVVDVAEPDVRDSLVAGTVDLCFARLPVDTSGFHSIRLWDEVPAVWVAKDHPISLYGSVTLADLAGETVLATVDDDSLSQVTVGEAVLRVPLAVARSHSRRDLAHRPITDAPTTTIALLWRVDNENPLIDEFVGIVGLRGEQFRTAQERAAKPAVRRRRPRAVARRRASPPDPGCDHGGSRL